MESKRATYNYKLTVYALGGAKVGEQIPDPVKMRFHQDVLHLDVTMDESFGVHEGDRRADLLKKY